MFIVKYRNLTDNGNTQGSWICYYYDKLKKQVPLDEEEIKRVEDYMKKTSGLDNVESAYNKITSDALDWAIL